MKNLNKYNIGFVSCTSCKVEVRPFKVVFKRCGMACRNCYRDISRLKQRKF